MNSPQTSIHDHTHLSLKNHDTIQPQQSKLVRQPQSAISLQRNEKEKRIWKKPESILKKLQIQNPLSFSHVHNVFDILGINESAIGNNNYEESYFKTMFYLKTVQRVQLRKHAVILQLKSCEKPLQPIQYLINRYKSFGDNTFYQIATTLESLVGKLRVDQFSKQLMKSFDSQPLSRFIDSMENQIYMCRAAPNKLVISRRLLELLGEDPENYAVELCKYKMPLREIISAESYSTIINKSLENLTLVCDFLNNLITPDELHAKTSVSFSDYLYNRQHKKIYCNLVLFMPTPQMSCVQVSEVLSESSDFKDRCHLSLKKRLAVQSCCEQLRYNEADVLKNIIKMPEGLLKEHRKKVAGFREISVTQ